MTAGPGRSWKWWVCGVLLLATMLLYMDRLTLAVNATLLDESLHLNKARYGWLEESFSYAFAAGGIFFGFVADRMGPRRLYPVVLAGWSIAGLATPLAAWPPIANAFSSSENAGSGEFHWLFLCRTALGFFESGHWPCALLAARNVLSADERPLGNSILQSGASIGAVLTPLIVEGFRRLEMTWQVPFVVIGVAGLFWLPLWIWLTRSGVVDRRPVPVAESGRSVKSPAVVAVLFALLIVIVVSISLTWQVHRAWQPTYLETQRGYERSEATLFASLYYLVADIGCLTFGAVVTLLVRRRVPVLWARLISFAGCTVLMAAAVALPHLERGPWLLGALLAVGAGALGAHPQYYALAQELPVRHMGVLSGVLSATSWVAVGFAQGRMGEYVERTGSYDLPFVLTGIVPVAGLIAFLAWVCVTKSAGRNAR